MERGGEEAVLAEPEPGKRGKLEKKRQCFSRRFSPGVYEGGSEEVNTPHQRLLPADKEGSLQHVEPTRFSGAALSPHERTTVENRGKEREEDGTVLLKKQVICCGA